jgi:hypothetical protein
MHFLILTRNQAREGRAVVANGHGEGEEFLEGVDFRGGADEDFAGPDFDAWGKRIESLAHDAGGSFNEHAGPLDCILAQFAQHPGEADASPLLVVIVFAGSQPFEVLDELGTIGETAGTDDGCDAGLEELLGSTAADGEQGGEGIGADEGGGRGA